MRRNERTLDMNILIYNWIPFDEKENKGGGVTVYTRNLLTYLSGYSNLSVVFLSSGRAYDMDDPKLRIEKTENILGEKILSYQVVNSPVQSSAQLSFPYPEMVLYDRTLKELLRSFILEMHFDVIHFQNLEGLSLPVLELKEDFPDTRFIYSIHNYYPFCPQVMLWKNNHESCTLYSTGAECIECMPKNVFRDKVILKQQINYSRMNGKAIKNEVLEKEQELEKDCLTRVLTEERKSKLVELFALYRQTMVKNLNLYMDTILAVSERVRQLAIGFGVTEDKVITEYIGTAVAEHQKTEVLYPFDGKVLQLLYLGYPRKNKGFFFLLDVLENIPDRFIHKIGITIAAPISDDAILSRLNELKEKYHDVKLYQGYTHDELPKITNGINLGIVPPLWEDNLPQVAIEMKAMGIPVLSSDMGGARELTKADGFTFKNGNIKDFWDKISDIFNGRIDLNDYYIFGMSLLSMSDHFEQLMDQYTTNY